MTRVKSKEKKVLFPFISWRKNGRSCRERERRKKTEASNWGYLHELNVNPVWAGIRFDG
jgi:hypothetical protein